MAGLIDRIIFVFTLLIFARVILTFIVPMVGPRPHPMLITMNTLVNQVTEPILGPIRRVLPSMGNLDFSPMVAILILIFVTGIIDR